MTKFVQSYLQLYTMLDVKENSVSIHITVTIFYSTILYKVLVWQTRSINRIPASGKKLVTDAPLTYEVLARQTRASEYS